MASPKTKLEKRIWDLSYNKLPHLNHKHFEYAVDQAFWKYFEISRGHIHCMECGHKWKPENIKLKRHRCPECDQHLRQCDNRTWVDVDGYTAIFQRCEEFQVIRFLFSKKSMKKGQEPMFYHNEVSQLWYDPNGKLTIMGGKRNGMIGTYAGGWAYPDAEKPYLTIKKDSYNRNYYVASPYKPNGVVYPNKQIIPELRRRGLKGSLLGMSPARLVEALFSCSIFETIYKMRDRKLIKLYAQEESNFKDVYWPSLKIARRHKYEISDLGLWKDYIDLLKRFKKDLRNPKFICPDNLEEAHNIYVEKQRRKDREARIRMRIAQAERNKAAAEAMRAKMKEDEEKYVELRKAFFDLCLKYEDIEITTIKSVKQLDEESLHLMHCAYTNRYHRKKQSLLLSAKVNGEVTETIEINLLTMEIVQVRGYDNEPTRYNKKIVRLVKKNMPVIRKLYEQQLKESA